MPQLRFHHITFNSLPLIMPYLRRSGSLSCDYTVGGIYLWIDWFRYEYSIYRHTLFVKGLAEDNAARTAFSLPIGELPIEESVAVLKRYCSSEHLPLEFSAITEERIDEFREQNPLGIAPLEQWSDYLYSSQALATLSGHDLKKKRNHVSKFISSYPDYSLEPIDEANMKEVTQFCIDLCSRAGGHASGSMAAYERSQTLKALHYYSRYDGIFHGLVLRAGSRVVAFAIGEVIDKVLHVHIEKADHSYAGSGEMINMSLVRHILNLFPEVEVVNRQDDAGDPGLRQSKQSYCPDRLLKKYNVIF